MDRMAKRTLSNAAKITEPQSGLRVKVGGLVQGVGFRPFIFNLATRYNLSGWVKNTSAGVEIEVDGAHTALQEFINALRNDPPQLARIDKLDFEFRPPNGYTQFAILSSNSSPAGFLPVPPDIAICDECRQELFDPTDRRFRYPFINCTNCGPRFSIIRNIPYDRPFTSMSGFPLCDRCAQEYHDPGNRRFHAQPIACPDCGPQIWLRQGEENTASGENAIRVARQMLSDGKILAVKGLGGFHLACDATDSNAVATLRQRKKRSDKPFALMAFDTHTVLKHCLADSNERSQLVSSQAPIVLLCQNPASPIVEQVAPGQRSLGLMLAYTPLHLLLLEPAPDFPEVLVMTSGNFSEEPISFRDDDAISRLAPLADAFLLNDRPIHTRVDDSVVMSVNRQRYFVRRARGAAPDPIKLPNPVPSILAAGAELKNTFCLTRDRYAFISHHIGDLENYETYQSYEDGISHYEKLFRIQPTAIACDLHPNYLSTRYAEERSDRDRIPLFKVQHHHAHLAACLADNGWASNAPVIGLCFDGTGLGTDGAIWGGEVLLGEYSDFTRLHHLEYAPMPGGDLAVRKPARMALSLLHQMDLDWEEDLFPVKEICEEERTTILSQIQLNINSPLTSSMGRLFDAIASLLGVRQKITYEGQAAIELEAVADPGETGDYPFDVRSEIFDAKPLIVGLINDLRNGRPASQLSARFHNSVARLSLDLCRQIRTQTGIKTAALSGGVWQNRFLLTRTLDLLTADGFMVLTHRQVPPNDGGISLGQAVIGTAIIANN